MGFKLGKIFKVALGVALVVGTGGAAAGVFGLSTAVGGSIAAGLGLSGWAAAAVGLAGTLIGTSLITSALTPKAGYGGDQSVQDALGTRQLTGANTANKLPWVIGGDDSGAYISGIITDVVWSTDNQTAWYVLALSEVGSTQTFTFDTSNIYWSDKRVVFDGTDQTKVIQLVDNTGATDNRINNELYMYLFRNGATTAGQNTTLTAQQVMQDSGIPVANRWPATNTMSNTCFAIVKIIYNATDGTTGLQPPTFRLKSNMFKAGDVWYEYMTNKVFGCGFDPSIVDSTSRTALNTYGDQLITYTPSGGGATQTVTRYRLNGVIDTKLPFRSNLDNIMAACDSWLRWDEVNGLWKVAINQAQTSVMSFNDNNVIDNIQFSPKLMADTFTSIEVSFPDGLIRDQQNNAYVVLPDNLKTKGQPDNQLSLSLILVNDNIRAQYLANRILEQNVEDLIISFNAPFAAIGLEAGDVIDISNVFFGWTGKLFRVSQVTEIMDEAKGIYAKVTCFEYNAQVYDNFNITQFTPAPNTGLGDPSFFGTLLAPTVTNVLPTDLIPSFVVNAVVPSQGLVTVVNIYYSTSSTFNNTAIQLVSQGSPNGVPYVPGSSVSFKITSLVAGVYYFYLQVGNSISSSFASPASAPLTWNPQPQGGLSGVAVNPEWDPQFVGIPTAADGSSPVLGASFELRLFLGTELINVTNATTDPGMPNNTWRIDTVTVSSGLTVSTPVFGTTTVTWTVTGLTSQTANLTASLRYKNTTGTVVSIGSTQIQVIQIRAGTQGASSPVLFATWSNLDVFTQAANNGAWTPTPISNVITTTGTFTVILAGITVGLIKRQITYNVVTTVWTDNIDSSGNINPGRFTLGTATQSVNQYQRLITYSDGINTLTSTLVVAALQAGARGPSGPAVVLRYARFASRSQALSYGPPRTVNGVDAQWLRTPDAFPSTFPYTHTTQQFIADITPGAPWQATLTFSGTGGGSAVPGRSEIYNITIANGKNASTWGIETLTFTLTGNTGSPGLPKTNAIIRLRYINSKLYALFDDNTLYYSTDNGDSWTQVNIVLASNISSSTTTTSILDFVGNADESKWLIIVVTNPTTLSGIYYSDNTFNFATLVLPNTNGQFGISVTSGNIFVAYVNTGLSNLSFSISYSTDGLQFFNVYNSSTTDFNTLPIANASFTNDSRIEPANFGNFVIAAGGGVAGIGNDTAYYAASPIGPWSTTTISAVLSTSMSSVFAGSTTFGYTASNDTYSEINATTLVPTSGSIPIRFAPRVSLFSNFYSRFYLAGDITNPVSRNIYYKNAGSGVTTWTNAFTTTGAYTFNSFAENGTGTIFASGTGLMRSTNGTSFTALGSSLPTLAQTIQYFDGGGTLRTFIGTVTFAPNLSTQTAIQNDYVTKLNALAPNITIGTQIVKAFSVAINGLNQIVLTYAVSGNVPTAIFVLTQSSTSTITQTQVANQQGGTPSSQVFNNVQVANNRCQFQIIAPPVTTGSVYKWAVTPLAFNGNLPVLANTYANAILTAIIITNYSTTSNQVSTSGSLASLQVGDTIYASGATGILLGNIASINTTTGIITLNTNPLTQGIANVNLRYFRNNTNGQVIIDAQQTSISATVTEITGLIGSNVIGTNIVMTDSANNTLGAGALWSSVANISFDTAAFPGRQADLQALTTNSFMFVQGTQSTGNSLTVIFPSNGSATDCAKAISDTFNTVEVAYTGTSSANIATLTSSIQNNFTDITLGTFNAGTGGTLLATDITIVKTQDGLAPNTSVTGTPTSVAFTKAANLGTGSITQTMGYGDSATSAASFLLWQSAFSFLGYYTKVLNSTQIQIIDIDPTSGGVLSYVISQGNTPIGSVGITTTVIDAGTAELVLGNPDRWSIPVNTGQQIN